MHDTVHYFDTHNPLGVLPVGNNLSLTADHVGEAAHHPGLGQHSDGPKQLTTLHTSGTNEANASHADAAMAVHAQNAAVPPQTNDDGGEGTGIFVDGYDLEIDANSTLGVMLHNYALKYGDEAASEVLTDNPYNHTVGIEPYAFNGVSHDSVSHPDIAPQLNQQGQDMKNMQHVFSNIGTGIGIGTIIVGALFPEIGGAIIIARGVGWAFSGLGIAMGVSRAIPDDHQIELKKKNE